MNDLARDLLVILDTYPDELWLAASLRCVERYWATLTGMDSFFYVYEATDKGLSSSQAPPSLNTRPFFGREEVVERSFSGLMLLELEPEGEEGSEGTGYFFPVHPQAESSPQFYLFLRCLPPGPNPEAIQMLRFVGRLLHARLLNSSRVVDDVALTFRQLRILGAIFQGLQNAELATAVGVSPATAKRDISEIFSFFGVASRKQLLSSRRALEVLEQNLDLLERLGKLL